MSEIEALRRARPYVERAAESNEAGWLQADADLRAIDMALEGDIGIPISNSSRTAQLEAALELCRPTIERCCDEPAINAMNAVLGDTHTEFMNAKELKS